MTLTLSSVLLSVDDHEAALGFYRDTLGLEVTADVGGGGMRWVTLAAPSEPSFRIVLQPVGVGASDEDRGTLADLLAKGLLGFVVFATDGCDATFETVRASGADVLQEPIDQPYGVRDCGFRDPAGNVVRFNQTR